jgi:uncharacterized C2H2 Zn-finger protein
MNIVSVVDQITKEIVGDIAIYRYQDKMSKNTTADNLVPSEGFTEETGADGVKVFSCKQCDKIFPVEKSMKSHFSQTHKNKGKGTKRVAASKIFLSEMDVEEIIDVEEKRTKVNEESFDFSQNGAIFNSTMQLCAQTIGKDNLNKEYTGFDNE